MAEQIQNSSASTLNGAINNVVTSLTVTNGAVFPASGNFRILIDSELMLCTARAGNVLTVTRNVESTSAASHSNGAAVTHVLTTAGLTNFVTEHSVTQTIIDAKGDILAGSAADTIVRKAVGADLTVLLADSSQTDGLRWGGAWSSYIPALTAATTNPTLGTGGGFTQTGRYLQLGKLVIGLVRIVFGTSGPAAGSGTYAVSLPVTALTTVSAAPLGIARLYDSSANNLANTNIFLGSSTTVNFNYGATYLGTNTLVSNATPWTWAASDELNFFFFYEAA